MNIIGNSVDYTTLERCSLKIAIHEVMQVQKYKRLLIDEILNINIVTMI